MQRRRAKAHPARRTARTLRQTGWHNLRRASDKSLTCRAKRGDTALWESRRLAAGGRLHDELYPMTAGCQCRRRAELRQDRPASTAVLVLPSPTVVAERKGEGAGLGVGRGRRVGARVRAGQQEAFDPAFIPTLALTPVPNPTLPPTPNLLPLQRPIEASQDWDPSTHDSSRIRRHQRSGRCHASFRSARLAQIIHSPFPPAIRRRGSFTVWPIR